METNTLLTSPGSRSLKVRNLISQDLVKGLYMSHGCPSTRARMDFLQYHSLKSRNLKWIEGQNLTKLKVKSSMLMCYIKE